MKITLESTTKMIEIQVGGVMVPARVWEGRTEKGTPCFAFITRIAPTIPEPLPASVADEFGRELQATHTRPSPTVQAIDMRFIL